MPNRAPRDRSHLWKQNILVASIFEPRAVAAQDFAWWLQDVLLIIVVHVCVYTILTAMTPAITNEELPDGLPHLLHFFFGVFLNALIGVAVGVARSSHHDEAGGFQKRANVDVVLIAVL